MQRFFIFVPMTAVQIVTVFGQSGQVDDKSDIIYWDIPYQDGELRAEGCDATGKVLSSYIIKTSGRPYALRATVDKEVLSTDKATAHVTIEVVDEQGTIVKLGDNDVTCQIEGPARLLGLEGSNNGDMMIFTVQYCTFIATNPYGKLHK